MGIYWNIWDSIPFLLDSIGCLLDCYWIPTGIFWILLDSIGSYSNGVCTAFATQSLS